MTDLTPQQRIAAYEWAAERIEDDKSFICVQLSMWYGNLHGHYFWSDAQTQQVFRELSIFDDTVKEDEWWFKEDCVGKDRKEARLFILGSCILMAGGEL